MYYICELQFSNLSKSILMEFLKTYETSIEDVYLFMERTDLTAEIKAAYSIFVFTPASNFQDLLLYTSTSKMRMRRAFIWLKENGYIISEQIRDNGKIKGIQYFFDPSAIYKKPAQFINNSNDEAVE